jgi:hypothetical protein
MVLARQRSLFSGDCVERQRRVGVRGTRPHLRGDPDGFHNLLAGRSSPQCRTSVRADAIRTLRHMRSSNSDELLCLRWNRAVGEYTLTKRAEGRSLLRRQAGSLLNELTRL